jgi:putative membrane protein
MTRTWLTCGIFALAMSMPAAALYAQGGGTGAGTGAQTYGGGTQRGSASQRDQTSGTKAKDFVEKMMIANTTEVQLGQMGVEHATSPEVKSFAQMMVTDHTQANQELIPLAQQLGIEQRTDLDGKHKAIAAKLSKLQGAEFDRQFMKAMVDAHKDVVKQTTPFAGAQAGGGSAIGTSGAAGGTGAGATGTTGSTAGSSTSGSGSGSTTGSGSTSESGSGSTSGSGSVGSSTGAPGGAGAASVTEYAAKTLPIVQQHLAQAQQLEKSVGKAK